MKALNEQFQVRNNKHEESNINQLSLNRTSFSGKEHFMETILALDIGNSDIVSVLYDGDGTRLSDQRKPTIKEESYKKYMTFFNELDTEFQIEEAPEAVIVSCVVPYIREMVLEVLKNVYPDSRIYRVAPGMAPDLIVDMPDPRELGADLAATAVGAYQKYNDMVIVADLGSASKLTIINEDYHFIGGIIMPGIGFQAKSLHQMIPHLPEIELKKPASVMGQDTITSIQSGIINGALQSVLGLAREVEKETGRKCQKVITGGLSKLYSSEDLEDFEYDEFLLSDGLYHIARYWLDSPEEPVILV